MDGQRAVFERGMLAQHLLLFREPARSKRYMNMPLGLAQLGRMWERAFCGSWLACDTGTSVSQANGGDAVAGKPAPTGACC